ncbi:hypothetical protein [Nocardia sp. NPDC057455]|uniref:hypothetical protein n=1 Tax=Nocardia sp. NPDC057455 TaxID=3346138 RepID=UPI00366E7ADA
MSAATQHAVVMFFADVMNIALAGLGWPGELRERTQLAVGGYSLAVTRLDAGSLLTCIAR